MDRTVWQLLDYPPLSIDSNTSIPAVIVTHDDGEALRTRFLYHTGYKLLVTSDIPPNLSYYLLPFVVVIGIGLLITISYVVGRFLHTLSFEILEPFLNPFAAIPNDDVHSGTTKSSTSSSFKKTSQETYTAKI